MSKSERAIGNRKKQYGLKGCPVRFVTAYGPRENETHAIIALIYKAVQKMNPYQIWGDGNQERDFTYVEDIVDGTILSAEKITDGPHFTASQNTACLYLESNSHTGFLPQLPACSRVIEIYLRSFSPVVILHFVE